MVRTILAVLAGLVVGYLVVSAIEVAGTMIFAPHMMEHATDEEAMKMAIETLPLGAFLAVLAAWGLGSFFGAWVASLIAVKSKMAAALAVGVVLDLAGIANMVMIPHPIWFMIVGVLLPVPAAWLGGMLGAKKKASAA